MLYEDIRRGCDLYHRIGFNFDLAYSEYFKNKNYDAWRQPLTLDYKETYDLVQFLNRFLCRMDYSNVDELSRHLRKSTYYLNLLSYGDILHVDFNGQVEIDGNWVNYGQVIDKFYNHLLRCRGVGLTVASKILHTINPNLFVMWDNAIIDGYGLSYTNHFLPEMQRLAKYAINQVIEEECLPHDDAIDSLIPCGNSLAKVLDEYNFVKFTRGLLTD